MKAPHQIKYNNKYYNIGDELPQELAEVIKPKHDASQKYIEDMNRNKPVNILTKTVKNN